MSNNKKNKRFSLFNFNKDGKGVKKEEADLPLTFLNFFKIFPRHFSKILSVNIAMVLGNFPIFFILPVLAGYFHNTSISPADIRYPIIGGILPFLEDKISLTPLLSTVGMFETISAWTVMDYVILGLSALAIFTFGPVCAGTTYIIRNLLKGEPVFMWDDMKYSIKRNLRQSIIYGIIDIALTAMLVYDIYFFYIRAGLSFANSMFFYVSLVSFVIYMFMRYYVYLMMVTFDLSLFKLFKNAMIFSFLGFKRNIMAMLGITLVAALNVLIFSFAPLMALGIALPLVATTAICTYIAAYAAWPKIKQIMIDPYYKDEDVSYDGPTEPIMRDVL